MHEIFSFRCLYFIFGIDGMNIVVHPWAVENEEAIREIRSSKRLEL
jgi:hypothetical protein